MERKYKAFSRSINRFLENYIRSAGHYPSEAHVKRVTGNHGMCKTALALRYCESHPDAHYFSFKNLDNTVARTVFSGMYHFAIDTSNWEAFFMSIIDNTDTPHHLLIFDDLDDRNDKEKFFNGLHAALLKDKDRRLATVLITNKDIGELKYRHDFISVNVSLGEICKEYPELDKNDAVRLYTISAGTHEIIEAYDTRLSFKDNMIALLQENSILDTYMQDLLSSFRSPESYNTLLYAIAIGHRRLSDIAKFADFSYNKCDKYLKALTDNGMIIKDSNSKSSVYYCSNTYIELWYRFIFPYRTYMRTSYPIHLIDEICRKIDEELLPKAFIQAGIDNFNTIRKGAVREDSMHRNVKLGGFVFDLAFQEHKGPDLFLVKIYPELNSKFGKTELSAIRKATKKFSLGRNIDVYIYLNGRFSNYAWKESWQDQCLHLVEIQSINTRNRMLSALAQSRAMANYLKLQGYRGF